MLAGTAAVAITFFMAFAAIATGALYMLQTQAWHAPVVRRPVVRGARGRTALRMATLSALWL